MVTGFIAGMDIFDFGQSGSIPLTGFPGYTIHPSGKVFAWGQEKKPIIKKGCAAKIRIAVAGVTREFGLATLLAQHFLPNPHNYRRIAFKDRDCYHCTVSNIEWVSDTDYAHRTLYKNKQHFNDAKGLKIVKRPSVKRVPKDKSRRTADTVVIPGYPGYYINPSGQVFLDEWEIHPGNLHNKDALMITLLLGDKRHSFGLAKLVASIFLPNPDQHRFIIFKDRNNKNCAVKNLQWASNSNYNTYLRSFQQNFGGKWVAEIDPFAQPIPGFPGYSVSTNGNVYCYNRELFKKRAKNRADRVIVKEENGRQRLLSVAKMLALTFLPNPDGHTEVVFIDGDYSNCCIDNLKWLSAGNFKRCNRAGSGRRHILEGSNELLGVKKKEPKLPDWVDPARVPIEGFPGYYISPTGLVYHGNRFVRTVSKNGKALSVSLRATGIWPTRYRTMGLATLVASHFLPNPRGLQYVIFKNRDRLNCHKDNLAWVDGETWAYYCGLYNFHTGRKKIVLEREVAIAQCTDELLRRYYITLDESWIQAAWDKIEEQVNKYDWDQHRSESYMYFLDRARRFSILRNATGLIIKHMKGLRVAAAKEISPEIPIGLLIQTDESLRDASSGEGYRSKYAGRGSISFSTQSHKGRHF